MNKKVAVIHTFLNSVEDIKALFAKHLPEVELMNIIDDSLLAEALANGGVTAGARQRYLSYALAAQSAGADAILNQCSSYIECADWAQQALSIPIVKIDEPMAREANRLGKKIGVIVTAASSLGPACRLVERFGGPDTQVQPCFVEGAYDALLKQGDKERHNALVIAAAEKAAAENDVVVLAQGSMVKLLPLLAHLDKPVLTAMESGIRQLRGILQLD